MVLSYLNVLCDDVVKAKLNLLGPITMFSELVAREQSKNCNVMHHVKNNQNTHIYVFEEHDLFCEQYLHLWSLLAVLGTVSILCPLICFTNRM